MPRGIAGGGLEKGQGPSCHQADQLARQSIIALTSFFPHLPPVIFSWKSHQEVQTQKSSAAPVLRPSPVQDLQRLGYPSYT